MRATHFIGVTVISCFILLLANCSTDRFTIQSKDMQPLSQTMNDTTIRMKFTNEEELEERFGTKNNPFISPPSALGLNRIMVFDVQLASTMHIVVQLKRVELQFGGKNKPPINRFHLSQFWENRIRESESLRGWNSSKTKKVVNQNVLPNELTVTPGPASEGLLVFMGRFPNYGTATVYLPVFNEDGKPVTNFKFDFEF
jgi:hypothetical protein